MTFKETYGPWALITGASSGIGYEFALQLAELGLNIVLVARRKDRLKDLATTLENDYHISTHIIAQDLTATNACKKIYVATQELDIGLLVNNAGFGSVGPFDNTESEIYSKMVVLNTVVPTVLTRLFIPTFRERKKSGLIFVASTAAYQAVPYMSVYSATKAYNLMLGEALWEELRSKNIDVFSLSPGLTETEFATVANAPTSPLLDKITAKPQDVVHLALQNIGKRPSAMYGKTNKLVHFIQQCLPRRSRIKMVASMFKFVEKV